METKRLSEADVKHCFYVVSKIKKEVSKVLVGQDTLVDGLICAMLCDGHALIEGVPGVAKTLTLRALSEAVGCVSKRIQFTVDLLPTDITGVTTYSPKKGFEVSKGPVFANFVLADEINRAPPKTQSALLEAMQEKQVTIGKNTYPLPKPFFVMATENPIEVSGVYTLPEAQIDRFLFKLIMSYPEIEEEDRIMDTNMTLSKLEDFGLKHVSSPSEIIKMQAMVKRIYIDRKIRQYILNIVDMTRKKNFEGGEYVEWGASPRATIALFIASKARALMEGRTFVLPKDVKHVAHDILRHRIIVSYRARAQRVSSDSLINNLLDKLNPMQYEPEKKVKP